MQWHKLHWKEEHCVIGGVTIRHAGGKLHTSHALKFTPHVNESHDMPHTSLHDLDFSAEAAKHPETGEQLHHLGDGVVDHITLHPVSRPQGISVHAVYRDKDGNPTPRQDAHIQLK